MNQLHPSNTSVVLLAAGRGERMQPLTNDLPKPLLKVGKYSLIEHHLYRLAKYGFKNIIINTAYLGQKIRNKLGDGTSYELSIKYSDESDTGALETAGGLKKALPLIQSNPFLVVNADIWTNFDFRRLLTPMSAQARLVLVTNPAHNPNGDFALNSENILENNGDKLTFSGIALYQRELFEPLEEGRSALGPILRDQIRTKRIEGLIHSGEWTDVGTPQRLEQLNKRVFTKT